MLKIKKYGPVTQFLLTKDGPGKAATSVACYYLDGYLIDSGQEHCKNELYEALKDYKLKRIVNTHSHEDHIGANRLLQQTRSLPPAWVHPLAIKNLETSDIWGSSMPEYRKHAWGVAKASLAEAIPDKIYTENYVLEVIHTPGHCKDHICLFERTHGWLFSGDLFISKNVNSVQYDENAPLIIESLEKILRYPVKTMFCSYGRIHENAYEQLKAKLSNLKNWQEQIINLHKSGFSEAEILNKIFKEESTIGILTSGCLSRAQFIHQMIYNVPLFIPADIDR